MWSKIYLTVLGLSLAVIAFFTFYSWSWLQSIGLPAGAISGYEYHSGIAWVVLWLSATALLGFGNAVLWVSGRAWAMWTTFFYLAVFIVIRYFWLGEAFFNFKKSNGLFDGSFSVGPFFAVGLIVLIGVIVFLDQFVIIRLRAKAYPAAEKAETENGVE